MDATANGNDALRLAAKCVFSAVVSKLLSLDAVRWSCKFSSARGRDVIAAFARAAETLPKLPSSSLQRWRSCCRILPKVATLLSSERNSAVSLVQRTSARQHGARGALWCLRGRVHWRQRRIANEVVAPLFSS